MILKKLCCQFGRAKCIQLPSEFSVSHSKICTHTALSENRRIYTVNKTEFDVQSFQGSKYFSTQLLRAVE